MKQGNRRNLLPKLIVVQVFVALALLAGALSSAASSGTTIAAGSASVPHGGQGTSTTIITRAAADASLNAYDITLSFDPAIVSVANVSPAAGWSLMPAPRINNAAGTVQVIAVRFDTCGLSCPAFSITWNGLAGGSSPLTLAGNADESLAGLGAYITSGFTSGTVTVSAPPTSTPTASPTSATPTATPSPSATPSPTVSPTATPIPSTPAPGAPAVIFGGSGGAPSGSTFTTTTRVNLAPPKDRPTSFDITLTFNPAVATVLSVVAGEGWSLAPQPVFDNATGTLHVSGLRFTPCSNYCPLFDTEWKAVAQGPTSLKLEGSADEVLGENGLNQPAVFTPGSIVVTPPQAAPESGGPKPAATPKKGNAPALPHAPGWNLLTWADEPMTPKEALSGSNPQAIEVIYVWDAAAGKWRRYAPNLPAYLSDLATIKSGDVIWLSSAK